MKADKPQPAPARLAGEVLLMTPISTRVLTLGFFLLAVAALAFASIADYARQETVVGWLIPEKGMIRTPARAGGLLERLAVREGQTVAAGGDIAVLRLTSDTAGGDVGAQLSASLHAESAAAEREAAASRRQIQSQRRSDLAQRAAVVADLAEADTRISLMTQRLGLASAEVERGKALMAKGFFTAGGLDNLKALELGAADSVAAARSAKRALQQRLMDIDNRLAQAPEQTALIEAQAARAQASVTQRSAANEGQSRYRVTSPVEGSVLALPASLGETLRPGGSVAVIMPRGSRLVAELYVPSRAAGFIRVGQEVRLKYQAFPYQTFGSGAGKVIEVSRTILAPDEVTAPAVLREPVFRVRVALARTSVTAYGRQTPLQPGMLLTADVVTDRRTLVEWMLDPIYAVTGRA